jgi:hypothetical protein
VRKLWLRGITQFEVLKPQVDDSGYDLVLEANGVTRHVQLKSSFNGAATKTVRASLKLLSKPSACVIWVCFNPATVALGPFPWFGGLPRAPLPDITNFKIAKHPRANAQGIKNQRPNQRTIPLSCFVVVSDLEMLVTKLFGDFQANTKS